MDSRAALKAGTTLGFNDGWEYDATQIWLSNGKDEDYTFGYSEEELENALS